MNQSPRRIPDHEVRRSRSKLVALVTLVAAIVSPVSTVITLLLTGQEIGLNKRGQVAERLARADDQLGSTNAYVQHAGIQALESVARESALDRAVVVDRLASFTRFQAPISLCDDARKNPGRDPVLRAAITAISRLNNVQDRSDRIDLSDTCLRGIHESNLNLRRIDFTNADLSYGRIGGADLTDANLTGANLTKLVTIGSTLTSASLCRATLTSARFDYTDLDGYPRTRHTRPEQARCGSGTSLGPHASHPG